MQGGSFFNDGGTGGAASFSVTDCRLTGLPYMYFWYPVAESEFLRNVFVACEPMTILLGGRFTSAEKLTIRNNSFSDYKAPGYPPMSAIYIVAAFNPANLIIKGNSFLDVGKVSIRLSTVLNDRLLIDATGNYWGTDDASTISNMTFDETDDLDAAGTITFDPFLTSPDPITPK
jgi:hypothetical protein